MIVSKSIKPLLLYDDEKAKSFEVVANTIFKCIWRAYDRFRTINIAPRFMTITKQFYETLRDPKLILYSNRLNARTNRTQLVVLYTYHIFLKEGLITFNMSITDNS